MTQCEPGDRAGGARSGQALPGAVARPARVGDGAAVDRGAGMHRLDAVDGRGVLDAIPSTAHPEIQRESPGALIPRVWDATTTRTVFFTGRLAPAAITVLSAFGRREVQPSTHGSNITTVTL